MRAVSAVAIGVALALGAFFWGRFRGGGGQARPDSKQVGPADSAATSLPRLDPLNIPLGNVEWMDTVYGKVRYINSGHESIVIESVDSSCGCTAVQPAQYEGQAVPPGESILIDYEFSTGAKTGPKKVTLTVRTKSGLLASTHIDANVVGTWEFMPDHIDFGDVVTDVTTAPPPSVVGVFRSELDGFLGVDVYGAPWIDHSAADRPDGTVEILFRVVAERLPPGQSTANVVLRTTCAKKPEAMLTLRARGVRSLNASISHVGLYGREVRIIEFTDARGQPAQLKRATPASLPDGRTLSIRIVDQSRIEIGNPSGERFPAMIPVEVTAEGGATCVVSVSVF